MPIQKKIEERSGQEPARVHGRWPVFSVGHNQIREWYRLVRDRFLPLSDPVDAKEARHDADVAGRDEGNMPEPLSVYHVDQDGATLPIESFADERPAGPSPLDGMAKSISMTGP